MNLQTASREPIEEGRIDRTLHHIGSAQPAPGLEDRILTRLTVAEARGRARRANRGFLNMSRLAFTTAAVFVACSVIVAGTVNHSRNIQPIAPGMRVPLGGAGVGPAAAARIADQPIAPPLASHPRSVRRSVEGSGSKSAAQRPSGIAVPKTPPSER
jgi:hypothetical protein